MCFPGFITLDRDTPSKSGLYVTGLPGVTLAQIDGITKDEQSDMDEAFQYLYELAQTNFKIDLQRALASKFHIDRNIVSRETSKFSADVNSSSDLAGVTIEYLRSKYSRLHISTAQVYLNSPLFRWVGSTLPLEPFGAAYGNGRFVVVGQEDVGDAFPGEAAYSDDGGLTWTSVTIPDRGWQVVTYSEALGLFIACGRNKTGTTEGIATSPDGVIWTDQTIPDIGITVSFSAIVASANEIVAIGVEDNTGFCIKSVDGITWTLQEIDDHDWSDLTYGDELFVAVSNDGFIGTSTNGVFWTYANIGGDFRCISYGNGMFIAAGVDQVQKSVDGSTWTEISVAADTYNYTAFGGGAFVLMSSASDPIVSFDGDHWSTIPNVESPGSVSALEFGGTRFISVQNSDELAFTAEINGDVSGFGTVLVYQDDADGQLLGTFSIDTVEQGKNTVVIDQDFDADKIFVAINPVGYFRKTTNKYFGSDHLSANKLSCTFPCGFGEGSVTQVNDGGLNVTFNVYCSFDKLICDNLNIFKYALWYRIGVDLMKERQISDRVTRFTVLSPERAVELRDIFNTDYQAALESAVMNLKLTEDTQCFVCKKPIKAVTSLP